MKTLVKRILMKLLSESNPGYRVSLYVALWFGTIMFLSFTVGSSDTSSDVSIQWIEDLNLLFESIENSGIS